jgi:hypothetical protein
MRLWGLLRWDVATECGDLEMHWGCASGHTDNRGSFMGVSSIAA